MQLYIPNLKEQNLIFFDIEYDGPALVQLAFLILTNTEPNIYVLSKSVNLYVRQNHPLNHFFTRYTHITDDFLCDEGIDLSVARTLVQDCLLDVDANNSMIISHGVKNDLDILLQNGINFKQIKTHYCTYNSAKKILKRQDRLSLKNVAAEGGYYMFNEHNAYADVWGTLHAFCFLKERENINKYNGGNLNVTNL